MLFFVGCFLAATRVHAANPVLTVSTLPDGSYTNTSTLNIAGSVSVDSGTTLASLTVNGADIISKVAVDGTFSHPLTLSAGANTVTIVATDSAGGQATDTRSITLDQAAPQLTIASPADNSKTGQSSINVTGTVNENSTVAIKVNSGGAQPASMSNNNFSLTVNLASGINTIDVTATDQAGNTVTQKRTVTYDNAAPTLQVTDPPQDITTSQNSITIKGTVSDLTAVTITISMDGATFNPPVAGGAFEQAVSFTADKTYQIMVRAVDETGHVTSVTRNVIHDSLQPGILITAQPPAFSGTAAASFKFTTSDATATLSCAVDGVVVATPCASPYSVTLADGSHTFAVSATDPAGNVTSAEYTWIIDTVAPVLTVSTLADQAHTANATLVITGTVAESGSGVKSLKINNSEIVNKIDGAGNFTYNLTLTPPNGNTPVGTVITITAADNAGNSPPSVVRTIFYDPYVPKVTITSPADNLKTRQTPVNLVGTVDKIVTFQVAVNGAFLPQQPPQGNVFNLPVDLAAGANTVVVTVTDSAGNQSSGTVLVTYDNQAPTLTVTEPGDSIRTLQSITVKGNVSDATNVTITISMDSKTFNPPVVNGAFEQLISFTDKKLYVITVKATDEAGNATEVQRKIIYAKASGDINGDGRLDVADALLALQITVGLIPQWEKYLPLGDVAPLAADKATPVGDGKINISDAVVILRAVVGSIIFQ